MKDPCELTLKFLLFRTFSLRRGDAPLRLCYETKSGEMKELGKSAESVVFNYTVSPEINSKELIKELKDYAASESMMLVERDARRKLKLWKEYSALKKKVASSSSKADTKYMKRRMNFIATEFKVCSHCDVLFSDGWRTVKCGSYVETLIYAIQYYTGLEPVPVAPFRSCLEHQNNMLVPGPEQKKKKSMDFIVALDDRNCAGATAPDDKENLMFQINL